MRLLHTEKLTLEYFEGTEIPRYAILSHRWSTDEVSYQQYQEGNSTDKSGYIKICELCKLARSRGLEWAWIDACCIDKSSSAELTESINSMWSYYRDAAECYAYLADVPAGVRVCPSDGHGVRAMGLDAEGFNVFRRSDWFKRGWTLQELIAPTQLIFYASDWKAIGLKTELAIDLSAITNINALYLTAPDRVAEASIAMRMSWAAKRKTTRIEDIAYSLLGLFDVNMPMLYGEGQKSFMRLQKKIIKKYDDESIFAWQGSDTASGMLALSPAAFAKSSDIVVLDVPPEQRLQYQLTNKGLELRIPSSLHGAAEDMGGVPRQRRATRPIEAEYPNYATQRSRDHSRARDSGSLGGFRRVRERDRRRMGSQRSGVPSANPYDNGTVFIATFDERPPELRPRVANYSEYQVASPRYVSSPPPYSDDYIDSDASTSPEPGSTRRRSYAFRETHVPHEKDWKRFQLACGTTSQRLTRDSTAYNQGQNDFLPADGTIGQIDRHCFDGHTYANLFPSPGYNTTKRPTYVGITLKRTETGWQRVNSARFEWFTNFTKKHEFSRSVYQVPQEGL